MKNLIAYGANWRQMIKSRIVFAETIQAGCHDGPPTPKIRFGVSVIDITTLVAALGLQLKRYKLPS